MEIIPPWGNNLVGIETQGQPNHEFQYNGKEKQEELGTIQGAVEMVQGATLALGGGTATVLGSPTGVLSVAGATVSVAGVAETAHGATIFARSADNLMNGNGRVNVTPTKTYEKPKNSTKVAQRASAQGKPCATCGGHDSGKRIADH